jgi:hypothetical protein
VAFSKRAWRFYLQNETHALRQTVTGDGPRTVLTGHLPQLRGTAKLFYRDRWFDRKATIRIGIDAVYRTGYDGHTYDPSTGLFRPLQGYDPGAYVRLDPYFSARVRNVRAWVRVVHVNEGFWQPGYWTVPFYPMLERQFSFGVNWRFFD